MPAPLSLEWRALVWREPGGKDSRGGGLGAHRVPAPSDASPKGQPISLSLPWDESGGLGQKPAGGTGPGLNGPLGHRIFPVALQPTQTSFPKK